MARLHDSKGTLMFCRVVLCKSPLEYVDLNRNRNLFATNTSFKVVVTSGVKQHVLIEEVRFQPQYQQISSVQKLF